MSANHRELAVKYFNEAWSLLDLAERTADQNSRMVNLAHASLLHWSYEGTPKNFAIGEWQISRVHAVLQHFDAAEFHARRSLELTQANNLGPFLTAYAYEALARSLALRHPAEASQYRQSALSLSDQILEPDLREQLLNDLNTIDRSR